MARHSALPHSNNRHRVAKHIRLVKQNITETAAQNDSEQGAARDEIGYAGWRKIGVSPSGQKTKEKIAANERQHVGHAIPPWPDRLRYMEDERIEMVQIVTEHGLHHQ